VLHVVAAGEIGGAERMLIDLVRDGRSNSAEHAIALLTPNDALRRLVGATATRGGVRLFDRGHAREGPVAFLRRAFGQEDVAWIADAVRGFRATHVHLHTFASQVIGTRAALREGCAVVRTEHSTRVYDDPTCWPFSRWSLERAHAVVAISEHVARRARERAPKLGVPIEVVWNGVDTARFATASDPPTAAAPPEGSDADATPFTFAAVGRLDVRKGFDLAIRALETVPHARLRLVGEGEERARLEGLTRSLGLRDRVTFVGFCDDVRPEIARADAIVASSRTEGLGVALLEAMAMGKPVVGRPIGGIVEVVRDGETGWLAPGESLDDLASAMRAASSSKHEAVARGRAARARVEAHFSLDAMHRGYAAAYDTARTRAARRTP
jgi:glycosyltransferase involved in cell wall biosynthesis